MSQAPTTEQIAAEKAKLRASLRAEYWKQVTNPHRHATGEGGHVFDPNVQRYISTRSVQYDYFKPTWKSGRAALAIAVVPMVLYYWAIKAERDTRENKIRTGQISYRDRQFKFI